MENRIITLDEFIIRRQNDFEYATGELTALLREFIWVIMDLVGENMA